MIVPQLPTNGEGLIRKIILGSRNDIFVLLGPIVKKDRNGRLLRRVAFNNKYLYLTAIKVDVPREVSPMLLGLTEVL